MKILHMDLINKITEWIKNYAEENRISSLVVGVSGGIDSALVSTLCASTGIPTHCVLMPIHQDPSHTERGLNHVRWLQEQHPLVGLHEFDLTNLYDTFVETMQYAKSDLGFANSRSRLRMVTLYQLATTTNGLVVGTGNKVEDFGVGFYTKYGDGGVDISPIADLMKTEVYELARELGINQEILDAQPTDGLWGDNRNDEDQIGATYPELEWAMDFVWDNWYWEQGMENDGFLDYDRNDLTKRERLVLDIYLNFHNKNKHKMNPIPVFKK
jgi:NAD+ synthase